MKQPKSFTSVTASMTLLTPVLHPCRRNERVAHDTAAEKVMQGMSQSEEEVKKQLEAFVNAKLMSLCVRFDIVPKRATKATLVSSLMSCAEFTQKLHDMRKNTTVPTGTGGSTPNTSHGLETSAFPSPQPAPKTPVLDTPEPPLNRGTPLPTTSTAATKSLSTHDSTQRQRPRQGAASNISAGEDRSGQQEGVMEEGGEGGQGVQNAGLSSPAVGDKRRGGASKGEERVSLRHAYIHVIAVFLHSHVRPASLSHSCTVVL